MANAYKCDRCGKYFENKVVRGCCMVDDEADTPVTMINIRSWRSNDNKKDVCQKCMVELFGGWAIEKGEQND